MTTDSNIRQKWWSRPLGHLIWFFITLVCMTLRKRLTGDKRFLREQQAIVAIWHNRIFVPCYFYRYVIRGRVKMSMLASASKDGTMLAAVAEDYGMSVVRGSSGRRGAEGFMDMVRELHAGKSMCITPDGPKGPVYTCRPGVIKLASLSAIPIVPIRIRYLHCLRVRSWDRFFIPLPFSRVIFEIGEPMSVPPELTSDALSAQCRQLEEKLRDADYSAFYPTNQDKHHGHDHH